MTDAERHSENGTGASTGGRVADAYRRLRGLIVDGRIAPGSRIIETEVADRLDVSRTPVSAAIQRLAREGFIEENGGNGGHSRRRISPLTREDARELMYLLGSLERLAARRVAELENGRRSRIVDDMRKVNSRLQDEARTEPPAPASFFHIDTEFHRVFVKPGGAPRLLKLYESHRPQAERYFRCYVVNQQYSLDRSLEEHEEMIEAIGTGDPDVAGRAVKRSWSNAEERLQRAIDRSGERGSW